MARVARRVAYFSARSSLGSASAVCGGIPSTQTLQTYAQQRKRLPHWQTRPLNQHNKAGRASCKARTAPERCRAAG
jgi:hypothetical protein